MITGIDTAIRKSLECLLVNPPAVSFMPHVAVDDRPVLLVHYGGEAVLAMKDNSAVYRVVVPPMFIYDSASVNGLLCGIVSKIELEPGGCYHDVLYRKDLRGVLFRWCGGRRTGGWAEIDVADVGGQVFADEVFRAVLAHSQPEICNFVERRLSVRAVQAFGKDSYKAAETKEWANKVMQKIKDVGEYNRRYVREVEEVLQGRGFYLE